MELNEDQQSILKEFRGRVEHLVPESFKPDHELMRWLIARDFDLGKAEDMLLKSLRWRKLWNVDDILNWEWPEALRKYAGYGMTGYDNEGCPVWLMPYSGAFMRGLMLSVNYKDFIRAMIFLIESSRVEMRKQSEKLGKTIWKQSGIFDLEGFSLLHYTGGKIKELFPDLMKIYEANYPEHLKTAYIINAPKIFSVGFAIIKPFLGDTTITRIQIYSKEGWKSAIFEDIPRDQIPEHYGGTQRDPDGNPRCTSKINYGGEVPKSYYLKNERKLRKSEDNYKTLNLSRGGKETITLEVKQVGSEIKWEFLSDDYDVGFGICRLTPSGEVDVLIPVQRVNSQLAPDEGNLRCTEAATYQVVFDNEYSYLRSKKLKYNVEVIPPSAVETTQF